MRYRWSLLSILVWASLSFAGMGYMEAQYPWSSVLSSSRAIDWTHAGLPATFPDGETASNPWTPPTRSQCGTTVNPSGLTDGTDATNINKALAACTSGHYVLLGSGTFYIENANNCSGGSISCIQLYAVSGVTLRGSGAQSTKLVLSGNSQIAFGIAWGNGSCSWTSGYSVGTTSLTMNGCSGAALVPGELALLRQCDTGYSGSPCAGTAADNGGLFVCGAVGSPCSQQSRTDAHQNQVQVVYVKSISGSCSTSCTVTFTPGLYAPNWASSQTPLVTWTLSSSGGKTATPYGDGLEDLTVDATGSTAGAAINLDNTYASWLKGDRIIGYGAGDAVGTSAAKNCLLLNNYLFADAVASGADAVFNQMGATSDTLMLNNIVTGGQLWNGTGGNEGNVVAYNYNRDSQTTYYQLATYDHEPGDVFALFESNQSGLWLGDNTWGTQDLSTVFRGFYSGADPPYSTATTARVITIDNYVRFDNLIGNVLGGTQITSYQSSTNYVYNFGSTDPLALSSTMRWGNYDTVTGAARWCGNASSPAWSSCSGTSEVPTSLSGNAASFQNSVPSTTALPCSFFLSGYTSTSCSPHPSGGTGLSWWKVCSSWKTFPSTCATTTVQPFPAIGPDVTGGPYSSGYAYDLPAAIAFKNLPVDASYQKSYAITGSTWSNGTETLTVSGLPSGSEHIIGPFQVSGGNCGTGTSEAYMTGSSVSSGTISFALASNPGTCSGATVLFPDVRQFDEGVYALDPAPGPPAPSGLTGNVTTTQ